MSAKKKVEKMLDKYSVEEFLSDTSIDMSPFMELFLEELDSKDDDDLDALDDAVASAMEALEIDEDDQELIANRVAVLIYSSMTEDDEDDEELEELYTGVEGQVVVLTGIALASTIEEREEPDWDMLLNLRTYISDFAETVWRFDGDAEMASEMLMQSVEAARICAEGEDYEQCLEIASTALKLFEDEVEEDEGMREAVGLLWYYMGEGEEDDDTAEEYYRNAIEILDDPDILDDPECDATPEILEDLKKDYGEDD